jgi:hypothetical protein
LNNAFLHFTNPSSFEDFKEELRPNRYSRRNLFRFVKLFLFLCKILSIFVPQTFQLQIDKRCTIYNKIEFAYRQKYRQAGWQASILAGKHTCRQMACNQQIGEGQGRKQAASTVIYAQAVCKGQTGIG